MSNMLFTKYSLVIVVVLHGIVNVAVSQSLPEPLLFNRGCRAPRGQFPHETFCQQYYNCWDGRASIEECPGKLLFNPVIQACDYPEAVNCGARLRNPEPAVTADGRCLKQFGIFPDQTDCTAFYKCSHGRAYRQICPYYTAFDDRYLVCVHAYEVECGGRGGVYGTLAPPTFSIPDGGSLARIGVPPGSSGSGWDRRSSYQPSGSATVGSQSHPPLKGAGSDGRLGGADTRSSGTRVSEGQNTATDRTGSGSSNAGYGPIGVSTASSGAVGGSSAGTSSSNIGDNSGRGTGGPGVNSREHGGPGSREAGESAANPRGTGGSAANPRGTGGSAANPRGTGGSAANPRGTGGSGTSSRGTDGSVSSSRGIPGGISGGTTGTRGGTGVSRGTHAGITGIVDKDISATGRERQYERPISPEATFRCPHPRGLYPNALDCSRFWLCREYKPSLLKCPTGQLFDLAALTCTNPEKAQCSSISPRT